MLLGFTLRAQDQSKMQSAYLYHFTKYMEWPSQKQTGDFMIAVVGNSPIYAHLVTMSTTKKVGMRKIVVRKYSSVSAVPVCHMLFLSTNKSSQFNEAVLKGRKYHALVITEKNGYGRRGAGINFVTINGKPKFEVSESAITKYGIKVSAKLVQLGIKV